MYAVCKPRTNLPLLTRLVFTREESAGKSGLFVQNGCNLAIPGTRPSSTLSQILQNRITMFCFAGRPYVIVQVRSYESHGGNRCILPSFWSFEESSFVKPPDFQFATILSHPFEQNAYVARLKDRNDCVVIDPGLEPEKILGHLERQRLVPAAILNTHGHSDHVGGNAAMKKRWPDCPLVIGAADAAKLTDPWLNLSANFGTSLVSPAADVTLNDGDSYEAAGFEWQVRTIPGHTAGHVVYLWEGAEPPVVFVGDVIFAGSIGRTDFPDGDFQQLLDGIRDKLFTLPDDTILLSGHGPLTSVGQEKRDNPFVGQRAH
jgi:hydroxyacylglutathione hydrolase